ncbi:hypothetical protein MD535_22225 [Vibrio sp. ZSDZ65]|uniref:Uncharacterized protein n=1 Tax=Vibrio qingdaonensis TaxID=2829491 RepID=A0A9X3HYS6_9VIBR|nr:hypothetical protein [Vibrio qingdaonensis]MCW8348709.1 hypothetical protein [Vibrio qingdaonensis]
MSQRTFQTHQYSILCGWDRPLQGYFLVIEDKDQDDPIYSNLDEPTPHPKVFDLFEAVLKRFGIVLPDDILIALYVDKVKNIGNSITNWGDIKALQTSQMAFSMGEHREFIHDQFVKQGLKRPYVIAYPDDTGPELLIKLLQEPLRKNQPIIIYPTGDRKLTQPTPETVQ